VISPTHRPLPDNTQHSQETNIHAPGGIRAHNHSIRAATDGGFRQRCHWDRLKPTISAENVIFPHSVARAANNCNSKLSSEIIFWVSHKLKKSQIGKVQFLHSCHFPCSYLPSSILIISYFKHSLLTQEERKPHCSDLTFYTSRQNQYTWCICCTNNRGTMKRRRESKPKHLLENKRYWSLKCKALERVFCRIRFGRGCGLVTRPPHSQLYQP